jgi:GNAT superfamily N-acetyltransferase
LKTIRLTAATTDDAPALAALRVAVAEKLTREFGKGHWSSAGTERGVLYNLKTSRIFVVRQRGKIVATLSLQTKKPWAIDKSYFTACKLPLFLTNMAVEPSLQGRGIGRAMLLEAERIARAWPANSICLDAYDTAAGAGDFYAKCGYEERGRVVYRDTPLIYYERMLDKPRVE